MEFTEKLVNLMNENFNAQAQNLIASDFQNYVEITGIRDSTLHNYKRGSEPSFKNMCKIADALDVSLDYFRKEESQWKN